MFVSRHWRMPKVVLGLLVLEFPLTVAMLTLFGIASPNLYRTKLWQEGADHGWNSDPSEVVYSFANYEPQKIPLVWSYFLTRFNLIVSVLSMFVLLTKVTLYVMHILYPLLSFFVHGLLLALYAYSLHGQSAPDTLDAERRRAWYITHSCSVASTNSLRGYCQQAKASFGVTACMVALFATHLILAIWSMIPTKQQRHARNTSVESTAEMAKQSLAEGMSPEQQWEQHRWQQQQQWEMQHYPRSPGSTGGLKSPMTPRTVAFRALDENGGSGDLPLRGQWQPQPYQSYQPYEPGR
ncbi:hypothetical protein H2201_005271 [Coniosporium apollinis]|uniref:MARVEL domain-containing protein n=1 Tax=Coniosporium apollinis TaxID=61459 RepID=A0ABQ9NVH2_9PEZI|nr:hypothetical protein H2201_005271 [Coniosporium apollinis]